MTNLLIRLFIKNGEDINSHEVRKKYGILSGIVGILCNLILFLLKLFIGIITSSVAVTAEAFNNLSDAGSSVVTFVGFKMASRPADKEHPFGHGRIEYISGLIVSLAIILMGIEFIRSSFENIFNPEPVSFSMTSLLILIGSIAIKLWMFAFNHKISKKIASSVMKAAAIDSLSDVITTITVIIGIIITKSTGINIDGYIGIVVSLFIIGTGVSTAKETINPLIGKSANVDYLKSIEEKVLSYPEIISVHDIFIHNYGPTNTVASLHIELPSNISFVEAHSISDKLENDLSQSFGGTFLIHADPVDTTSQTD